MIQQIPPPHFPGESRDPLLPWAPAFAGEAVLGEVLHRRVNGVAGWTIKGAIIVGSAALPGGTLPSIVKGLGSAGANAGLDSAIKELTQHGAEQTSRWLENALGDQVRLGKLTADLAKLTPLSPEARRQWLIDEHLVDDVLTKSDVVRPEDRPIVEGMLLHALDDRITRRELIQADRDREQDQFIAEEARQIGAVSRSVNEFRTETVNQLKEIKTQQQDIADGIDKLTSTTTQTRQGVEFIQQFMFEKMEPSEKLAALRSGMFPGMPDTDRERLAVSIDIVEKRQKLMKTVSDFGQGAAAVGRIADRLHVDPNVVQTINKAAQAANIALTAATGLMNGGLGYLQAADAVTGLIVGNGPDIGGQRHEQITQALRQIHQDITEIKQMIAMVSKQVEEVRALQIATLAKLDDISKQIQVNQVELLAEIAQIRKDLVPINSTVIQMLFSKIERCSIFRNRLRSAGFMRERSLSAALPFELLYSIDQINKHGTVCREGLRERLGNPFGPEITYALDRFRTPKSDAENFLNDVYQPSWEMLTDTVLTPDRVVLFATSFTTPVATLNAVGLKRDVLLGATHPPAPAAFADVDTREIQRRLGTALSTQIIWRHACFLAYVHPFFDLDVAMQQRSPEKIAELDNFSTEGRELLKTTLALVDTAIAQQVMLGGDIALNDLDNIWRNGTAPKALGENDTAFNQRTARWAQLRKAIKTNGALRYNLVLQAVSRSVRERGNALFYGFAYGLADNVTYLKDLLPEPQFRLEWKAPSAGTNPSPNYSDPSKSTGWHLIVGDDRIPLPAPNDLQSEKLSQTPELRPLLDLRSELAIELDSYTTTWQLSSIERKAIRQAVWQVTGQANTIAGPERKQACESGS